MLHLGHRKPTCIHWKADALKTSNSLVRILVKRHKWVIFLRKWASRGRYSQWRSLSGHIKRIEEKDIDNIWFQQDGATRHTAEATLDVLLPVFKDSIVSHRADVLCHLWAAIWHRWTIICGLQSKISVTPTSQRQLTV